MTRPDRAELLARLPYDPDPLSVREDELVERPSLNDAIRRARPRVDSPLADFITGKIDRAEMDRRFAERDRREREGFAGNQRIRASYQPRMVIRQPARFHARYVVFVAAIAFLAGVLARSVWPG